MAVLVTRVQVRAGQTIRAGQLVVEYSKLGEVEMKRSLLTQRLRDTDRLRKEYDDMRPAALNQLFQEVYCFLFVLNKADSSPLYRLWTV